MTHKRRNPAGQGGASGRVLAGGRERTEDTIVARIPQIQIDVEPSRFGWDVVGNRAGRRVWHRHSYGLLSVANKKAETVAAERNWRSSI